MTVLHVGLRWESLHSDADIVLYCLKLRAIFWQIDVWAAWLEHDERAYVYVTCFCVHTHNLVFKNVTFCFPDCCLLQWSFQVSRVFVFCCAKTPLQILRTPLTPASLSRSVSTVCSAGTQWCFHPYAYGVFGGCSEFVRREPKRQRTGHVHLMSRLTL